MIYVYFLTMVQPTVIRSSHWTINLQKLYVHRKIPKKRRDEKEDD